MNRIIFIFLFAVERGGGKNVFQHDLGIPCHTSRVPMMHLCLQNVLLFSDPDSSRTQGEKIIAHLCHLHVININRAGVCVPAARQSHMAQRTTFLALKMKPEFLSYCQTFFICIQVIFWHLPTISDQIRASSINVPSLVFLPLSSIYL